MKYMLANMTLAICASHVTSAEIWKDETSEINCMALFPKRTKVLLCIQKGGLVKRERGFVLETTGELVVVSAGEDAGRIEKRLALPFRPILIARMKFLNDKVVAIPNQNKLHFYDITKTAIVGTADLTHTIRDFYVADDTIVATGEGKTSSFSLVKYDNAFNTQVLTSGGFSKSSDLGAAVAGMPRDASFVVISHLGEIKKLAKNGTITDSGRSNLKLGCATAKTNNSNGKLAVGCGRGDESVVIMDQELKQSIALSATNSVVEVDL